MAGLALLAACAYGAIDRKMSSSRSGDPQVFGATPLPGVSARGRDGNANRAKTSRGCTTGPASHPVPPMQIRETTINTVCV